MVHCSALAQPEQQSSTPIAQHWPRLVGSATVAVLLMDVDLQNAESAATKIDYLVG